ncbi:hypothetical protein M070_1101 [Bacteroides fragilis str. A7 (UDC12-2)]|nr:hypothetical protein M070_1101 [Bacteroides fragilis str. A7 (UDC12-2)]
MIFRLNYLNILSMHVGLFYFLEIRHLLYLMHQPILLLLGLIFDLPLM